MTAFLGVFSLKEIGGQEGGTSRPKEAREEKQRGGAAQPPKEERKEAREEGGAAARKQAEPQAAVSLFLLGAFFINQSSP